MPIQRRQFLVATTAAAMAASLPGCGGGGGSEPEPAAKAPAIKVRTFAASNSSSAEFGTAYKVDNVVNAGGRLSEQAVRTPGGTHRVFFDSSAQPLALRLADGTSLRFSYPFAGRVDVVATNAGGVQQWGLALYEEAGRLRVAPLGAAFKGQQINASLSGVLQGSLTVSADPTDAMAGVDRARSQALSASLVDALMAGVPVAAAAGAGTAQALAASGAQALSASGAQIGGGLLRAGVLGGTLMAAGYFLPGVLAGTAAAGALATVGSALLIGAGAYTIATGIADMLAGGAKALSEDGMDEAASSSASPQSLIDRLHRGLDAMQASGRALANRVLDIGRTPAAASDSPPVQAGLATLPALSGALGSVASRVRGALVDTAGRLFTGGGTLEADGRLGLDLSTSSGARATVQALRSGNSISGSYTSGGLQGSLSGTQAAVGACNVSSSSGGAGAFSYSYNVGRTSGSFPFDYNMYSVPDQARIVDINGRELFNTGGLVSGSRSTAVNLQGESNVVVLINAPNSGTAWDFTIGCAR